MEKASSPANTLAAAHRTESGPRNSRHCDSPYSSDTTGQLVCTAASTPYYRCACQPRGGDGTFWVPAEEAAQRCKTLVSWSQSVVVSFTTTPCRVRLGRSYLVGDHIDTGMPSTGDNPCRVPNSRSTPCSLVERSKFQLLCKERA